MFQRQAARKWSYRFILSILAVGTEHRFQIKGRTANLVIGRQVFVKDLKLDDARFQLKELELELGIPLRAQVLFNHFGLPLLSVTEDLDERIGFTAEVFGREIHCVDDVDLDIIHLWVARSVFRHLLHRHGGFMWYGVVEVNWVNGLTLRGRTG